MTRESEWKDYLLKIRQGNARKKTLIQILDRLHQQERNLVHPIVSARTNLR
jgi:hypothetical protein